MVEISLPTKNAPNFQFTLAKNILEKKEYYFHPFEPELRANYIKVA